MFGSNPRLFFTGNEEIWYQNWRDIYYWIIDVPASWKQRFKLYMSHKLSILREWFLYKRWLSFCSKQGQMQFISGEIRISSQLQVDFITFKCWKHHAKDTSPSGLQCSHHRSGTVIPKLPLWVITVLCTDQHPHASLVVVRVSPPTPPRWSISAAGPVLFCWVSPAP